jgi:adenylate cyclase
MTRIGRTRRSRRSAAVIVAATIAAALPLIGLASLLLRNRLDPHIESYRAHFVVFGVVGLGAFVLGHTAGEAAKRRGDARVLLLSLAFMATGGFLMIHAYGTPGVLFHGDYPGFKVAIPVGLLVSAVFAALSAFVDVRPGFGPWLIRNRRLLRAGVVTVMGAWLVWTVLRIPPLRGPEGEAARNALLATTAVVATVVYAASAARYWKVFRNARKLLPAAVFACFLLLAEAMVGVAVTGEREWHASWWEWHALILIGYVLIGFAARREWHEERYRDLYLPTTRERHQEVSVLFGDLVGFTTFAERAEPDEVAAVLNAYWGTAAPLLTREFGAELEKFIGDGLVATFNSRGNHPTHPGHAASTTLALQERLGEVAERHPDWPRMRVGVNSGDAVLREMGGQGHVAYALVGDTINTASRLEGLAPPGGVLIGEETFDRLPTGAVVETIRALRLKGKTNAAPAYVLLALPG